MTLKLKPIPDFVYFLSGPMTDIPDCNYPAFERAAIILRAAGFNIRSPHENHPPDAEIGSLPAFDYYRKALELLYECDALILLRGWPQSRGANLELDSARMKNYPVFYFDEVNAMLIDMNKEETNGTKETVLAATT